MIKKRFKAVELMHLDSETVSMIRNWRNQEFIRKNMFTQNIIDEVEHFKWIEEIKNDSNRHLFVFYLDNVPFAVMQSRYYPERDYVETGDYLISEDYQFMGYGTFIKYFTNEIMFEVLKYKVIHGEVLDTNKKNINIGKRLHPDIRKREEKCNINGETHEVYVFESTLDMWENRQKQYLGKVVEKYVYEKHDIIL